MILGLSPMDGITDCAYRLICQDVFSKRGKSDQKLRTRTEFMNADGYLINPTRLIHHLLNTGDEHHLIAQIYGGNHDALLRCAVDIDQKYASGFAGLELNIGCPSPKVMSCGGGAGMLREKQKTLEIIKTISKAVGLPFSIKTRAGLTQDDQEEQFAFICEAAQYCHMVAVHGRTYKQSHSGDVNRDFIGHVKQAIGDKCLVLGNGGIKSYEQALEKAEQCDGIMIGQAAIGWPWIFTDHEPSISERKEVALNHLKLVIACEIYLKQHLDFTGVFPMPTRTELETIAENLEKYDASNLRSPIEFRKYLFNYVTGLVGNKEFKQKVAQMKEWREIQSAIEEFLV